MSLREQRDVRWEEELLWWVYRGRDSSPRFSVEIQEVYAGTRGVGCRILTQSYVMRCGMVLSATSRVSEVVTTQNVYAFA